MKRQYRHPDRWLFLIAYPLIALAVVHIGNDNSLEHFLREPTYLSDLLLSFTLTYATGLYLRWFYRNHALPGGVNVDDRAHLGKYLLWVLFLPISCLAALEYFYVSVLLDIPAAEITLWYLELPLIAMFCLLINAFYLIVRLASATSSDDTFAEPRYRDHFLVHAGAASRRVEVAAIAYFEVVEKTSFLVERDGRRSLLTIPLRDAEAECNPEAFFLLNRQVLARRISISGFERTRTRKLRVHLDPPSDSEQFVSKTKATAFVQWLEGAPSVSESNRAASAE